MRYLKQSFGSIIFLCLFFFSLAGSLLAAPVLDADGRVTLVQQPFQRIISLYGAHTRNLLDMGAGNQIIAVGRSDKQLPGLPAISFRDDPERFLALKPDLVLIRPMISRGYPRLVERLLGSGVAVVSLQPSSMDGLFRYWETLGRLSGHEDGVKRMIGAFGSGLAQIKLEVDHIPQKNRKNVYFEAIHKRMKTFAPGSMAIFVLESAGGINVAKDALQVRKTNIAAYGKEKILSKAGRIDVFLAQKGRMNPVTVDMIRNEPGFQVIKAIQEKQVFLVDEKMVSRPTLGLVRGIETVFNILYPFVQEGTGYGQ